MEQKGSIYHRENLFFKSSCYSFASIGFCKSRAFISGPCQGCDWIINTHRSLQLFFPHFSRGTQDREVPCGGFPLHPEARADLCPYGSWSSWSCFLRQLALGNVQWGNVGLKTIMWRDMVRKTLKWSLGEMWDLERCKLCFRVAHE